MCMCELVDDVVNVTATSISCKHGSQVLGNCASHWPRVSKAIGCDESLAAITAAVRYKGLPEASFPLGVPMGQLFTGKTNVSFIMDGQRPTEGRVSENLLCMRAWYCERWDKFVQKSRIRWR